MSIQPREIGLAPGANLNAPSLDSVEASPAGGDFVRAGRWLSYRTIGTITGILDYLLIVGSGVAAGMGYPYFVLGGEVSSPLPYLGIANIAAALFVLLIATRERYRASNLSSFEVQAKAVILCWIFSILFITLFLFLVKIGATVSRGTIILFFILGLSLLLLLRVFISSALKAALTRGTLAGDRAVVIGDEAALEGLTQLSILRKYGAREVSRFLLPTTDMENSRTLAVIDHAIRSARLKTVDCILLALNWSDERRRNIVCDRLQALPLPVQLLPDHHLNSILSRARVLGPDFTVEIQRAPLSAGELAIKRTLDLVLAGTLLVLFIPLFAAVALLIKITSAGPVIFCQRRNGFNGREFKIYKFRTMTVLEDGSSISQARQNDARVTGLGRILRATSIDELPQLVNVLRGQMSLVGPRPHALAHDDGYTQLIANYAYRQHVKPGLTGWAQVHGLRGETAELELMEKRVALDLWYVKNWNIWLDLKIIVRTCFVVLRGRNAY